MIGPLDDLPVHQTPEPLAGASARDFGERYRYVGWTEDGSVLFAMALGLWPGREIVDGAFTSTQEGVQRAVLASGRLDPSGRVLEVGPLRVEVLEPMVAHRLTVDAADVGFAASLQFTATVDPHHTRVRTGEVDQSIVTQFGTLHGTIRTPDSSLELHTTAVRSRTWGTEPIGERPERGRPLTELPNRHTYALDARLGDRSVHRSGPLDDLEVAWRPGTRWVTQARLGDLTLDPVNRLLGRGLGDLDPTWTDGAWKGDGAIRVTSWSETEVDPERLENLHALTLCRITSVGVAGLGLLDVRALGAHESSGLSGWTDGA